MFTWSPKTVGHHLTFYISERGEDELGCGKSAESPCQSFNFVWSKIEHVPSLWSIVKSENNDTALKKMWDQNRESFKEYVNETANTLISTPHFDCMGVSTSDLNSVCDEIQFKFFESKSNCTRNLPNEDYLEMLWKSCDDGKQIYKHELSELCSNILLNSSRWDDEELRTLLDSRTDKIYNQIKSSIISGLEQISFNLISDSDFMIDKMRLNTGSNNDTHYHISVIPKNHTTIEMNVKDSIISKFTFHVNANQISLQVQNCSFKETDFDIYSKIDSGNLPVSFNNCKFYGDVFDSVIQIENTQNVSLLSCSFLNLNMTGSTNIQKSQDSFVNEQTKCLALLICSESQIEIQDISFSDILISYSESCLIHSHKCNITVSNISVQNTSVYSTLHGIVRIQESTLFIDGISFGNNYIEVASVFYTYKSILTIKYGTFDNNTITYKLVSIASDSFGIIDSSEFLNNIGNRVHSENPDYSKSLIDVTFGGHLVLQNSYFQKGIIRADVIVHCDMNASITVENSTFSDNLIALFFFDTCKARVLSSTFVGNHGFECDIVKVSRTEIVLMDSILSNNSVSCGNLRRITQCTTNITVRGFVYSYNNMSSGHLLTISKSNVNIAGTVFSYNNMSSGHLLSISQSKANITGTVFSHNNSTMSYRKLLSIPQYKVNITGTVYSHKNMSSGELISIFQSSVNVTGIVLSQNNIRSGLILSIFQSNTNITGTEYSHNNISPGLILLISQSNTSITENVFSHNNISSGQLLDISESYVNITGTVFSHNNIIYGQLLTIFQTKAIITGTVFSQNNMRSGRILSIFLSNANITGTEYSHNIMSPGMILLIYQSNTSITENVFSLNNISSEYLLATFQSNTCITGNVFSHNNMSSGQHLDIRESNVNITGIVFSHKSISFGRILAISQSNTNITGIVFSYNNMSSGGLLSILQSNTSITGIVFSHNNITFGELLFIRQSNVSITGTVFSHNNMRFGSIVAVLQSIVNITETAFSHNTLSGPHSVLYIAALVFNIIECTFEYNVAQEDGYIIHLQKKSAIMIFNCIFLSNHAYTGSIGSYLESNVVLDQCFFKNNSASQNGGILSSKESMVTVKNCTILGNKAWKDAGVLYATYHSVIMIENTLFQNNSCVVEGGVIKAYRNNTITIINSSFTNNKAIASNAGTILLENECSLTTKNCSFFDNVAASKGGTILVLDHSQYQDTGSHFIGNTASDIG